MKIEKIVPGEFQRYMFGKKGATTKWKGHIRYLSFDSELPPQRPDWTIYGVTLVNLLGKYGNFETDSNSDGLADGWIKWSNEECSLTSGIIGTNSQYAYIIYESGTQALSSPFINFVSNHTYFFSVYMKTATDDTDPRELGEVRYPTSSGYSPLLPAGVFSSWTRRYAKFTTDITDLKRINFYITADFGGSVVGKKYELWLDGAMLIDLTAMGQLPPPLQELYGVQNWADLDTDTLAQLLPYVDSVAAVGYTFNEGTLTVTVENRGKNLWKYTWSEYIQFLPSIYHRRYYTDGKWLYFRDCPASNISYVPINLKKGATYTISFELGTVDVSNARLEITNIKTLVKEINVIFTGNGIKSISFTPSDSLYTIKIFSYIENQWSKLRNFQIEESSSASEYEPALFSEIQFTTELHGFEGIYDQLNSSGSRVKHFTRETGITFTYNSENDVSTATVSSNATGTAIIVNESNGEVVFGTADGSTTISVSGQDLSTGTYTIIYQLATPTSETVSITGDLIIVPDRNTIIGPDMGFIVIEGTDSIKKAFNTLWR